MKVFAFIDAQKTEFDVKTLYRVCSVSRSVFYEWSAAVAGECGVVEERGCKPFAHSARRAAACRAP